MKEQRINFTGSNTAILSQDRVREAAWIHYVELTKPRLLLMVLLSTAVGFCMAPSGRWMDFALTVLATAFVGGGAMALNQYLECESDAQMTRTQNRPIPAGLISPARALFFGLVTSLSGFLLFAVFLNWLSAFFALATSVIYLAAYTPLKKRSSLATFVGAVSGALPPLVGWSAAGGNLDGGAISLFLILFFWQLPHFLSIDWMYRADHARAGFRTLSVIDPAGDMVARQMVVNMSALFCVSLLPTIFGLASGTYFFGAFLLGIGFSAAIVFALPNLNERARYVLRASIFYLALILVLMVSNKL